MEFKHNPLSSPIDTIPENSLEAKAPFKFDYFHASINTGTKLNTQVKTVVTSSDGKVFERFEEFSIPEEDLELCVTQSIQNYLLKFGLSENSILSLFKEFNFDASKTMSFNHY